MANYLVTVSGVGQVGVAETSWRNVFDFTAGAQGWTINAAAGGYTSQELGVYSPGVGFEDTNSGNQRGIKGMYISFADRQITSVVFSGSYSSGGTVQELSIRLRFDGVSTDFENSLSPSLPRTFAADESQFYDAIAFAIVNAQPSGDPGGSVTVTGVTVEGKGTNPFSVGTGTSLTTAPVRGDALFKIDPNDGATAWGGAGGIQFNGANVELANVSPSAYNPSHIYSFIANGTDTTWTFNFADTDGIYTDNSGSLQVTIEELP